MSATPFSAGRKATIPYLEIVLALAAVTGLFAHTWLQLADLWNKDANYSHGWFIPILAAIPAWMYIRRTPLPMTAEPFLGCMYLAAGGVCHLVAQVVMWPPIDFFGLVLILRGLALAAGGRAWARGFTFPILFLFFMFPLPVKWTGYVSIWLQDVVSIVSATVLDPLITCYQRGNRLELVGVSKPLIVAEECSGLRQIVAFVAAGAYFAYFTRRQTLYQILLVLAAIPVAIVANVLRVMLMAIAATRFGLDWLSGPLHSAPAVFSIPAGLALYALVGWGLGKLWPRPVTEGPP